MPASALRCKATAFILRRPAGGQDQLLVYTQLARPDVPWRLPGGNVDAGETPDAALRRELDEEAGLPNLPGLTLVRKLGVQRYFKPYIGAEVERHDYLLRVNAEAPARWTLRVTGSGGDAGELYGFRWINVDEVERMDEEHGAFVRPDYIPELFAAAPKLPPQLAAIEEATGALGFSMASDRATGELLAALAASKLAGNLLELGTGTGLATSWLLHGMDAAARLLSVDSDASVQAVAAHYCGSDPRLTLAAEDGDATLTRLAAAGARYDLIFADTWPGKFRLLAVALELLKPGGFYVVDDLLPHPNWPPNHGESVAQLLAALRSRPDLVITQLDWSTGLLVAVKQG